MKLYIDDANVSEIRRLIDLYPIDGVTTNPSILSKVKGDPIEVLKEIRAILGEEKELFVQAIPTDAEGMVKDAHAIVKLLGQNTVVKIPSVPEGFKAIRILREEGIRTCGTVVYTPMQAYLAAKAGASYVAPYVNRIDNMGYDGITITEQIQDILTRSGREGGLETAARELLDCALAAGGRDNATAFLCRLSRESRRTSGGSGLAGWLGRIFGGTRRKGGGCSDE